MKHPATQEEIDASLEGPLDHINKHVQGIESAMRRALKVTDSPAPPLQRLIKVRQLQTEVEKVVQEASACRQGCNWCCHQAVTITSLEAAEIAKHTGIPAVSLKTDFSQTREGMVEKYRKVACPFLKDGICSIYEVRPSPCRTHYNLSGFPDLCDLFTYPEQEVPNFDWRIFWDMHQYLAVQAGCEFGDLREFFPNTGDNHG